MTRPLLFISLGWLLACNKDPICDAAKNTAQECGEQFSDDHEMLCEDISEDCTGDDEELVLDFLDCFGRIECDEDRAEEECMDDIDDLSPACLGEIIQAADEL